ncbi:MAG TPA: response regulator transcription factor [Tepidisphaeraceae bacterium]|jgi:DNA-binding NarL/FixJ family response regulator|nr:response regulator transcription factor [Tepidisphaeraceae bacterium]
MSTIEVQSSTKKASVFVVEDHPIVRHGLMMLINDEEDMVVSGEAESVADAMEKMRTANPDVIVVDIALGDGSGLDLIKDLHAAHPNVPLLAVSMHDESIYAERALRAGAKGYIMKKAAMDSLLVAIRRVLSGEIYLSEAMSSRLLRKLMNPGGITGSPIDSLTDREFQVFRLIAEGVGPSEIANRLNLSVKTIETHREHIKEKLGLKSGTELTRFSLQWSMENR